MIKWNEETANEVVTNYNDDKFGNRFSDIIDLLVGFFIKKNGNKIPNSDYDDLLQDVKIHILKELDKYDEKYSARSYIETIVCSCIKSKEWDINIKKRIVVMGIYNKE